MSTPKEKKVQSRGGMDFNTAPDIVGREDAGVVVHLHDEAGEELFYTPDGSEEERPVTITMAGSYSSRFRKAQEAQTTRVVNKKNVHVTGALLRVQKIELTAACFLAWDGFFEGGVPIECDKENVLEAFKKYPFVLEQAEAAMGDHAGFSKGS